MLLLQHAEYTHPGIPDLPKRAYNHFGELFSLPQEIRPVSSVQRQASITGASKQGCIHSSVCITSLNNLYDQNKLNATWLKRTDTGDWFGLST